VRVKDVIGEPDWFAFLLAGEETPDRLIRGQNSAPDAFGYCVRDSTIKRRAIAAPEHEPRLEVVRSRRTDNQLC
jgi:hypothetical protein